MSIFAIILAVLKAIPALKGFFDEFASWYTQHEIASIKDEYLQAMKSAILDHDQRKLEEALGSPRAGELSGVQGTEERSSLPGVNQNKS